MGVYNKDLFCEHEHGAEVHSGRWVLTMPSRRGRSNRCTVGVMIGFYEETEREEE